MKVSTITSLLLIAIACVVVLGQTGGNKMSDKLTVKKTLNLAVAKEIAAEREAGKIIGMCLLRLWTKPDACIKDTKPSQVMFFIIKK